MTSYRVTSRVQGLPATVPFVGPEAQERVHGHAFQARLGANENAFGPSPRVLEAIARDAAEAWKYGDPEFHELREALASALGVEAANVMVGEGIDGLLGYVARMFLEPGDCVVTSAGAYPTFNYHVQGFGGRLEFVPYREDREDLTALLAAAIEYQARLIYVSNPDNPMGSWWSAEDLQPLMDHVPAGALLILDEAYGEFAPSGTLPPLDLQNAQVLRLRTFSKAHGLAGMRVGYAIGNADLIAEFHKVRNHFGVGRLAQTAALAALQDSSHLDWVRSQVAESLQHLREIALNHGLHPLPTATNFLTMDCSRDGAYASAVMRSLIRQGVFVRKPGVAPLDRCIRVTAGLLAEQEIFAQALPQALREAATP